ncbi:MAG TPA: hypothetical protein VM243_19260 [Phycisphaerae bacterium]|nr:hypothetical protein [Phycisphaerae bacterium]
MSAEQHQSAPAGGTPAHAAGGLSARRAWLLGLVFAAAVYLPTMAPGLLWGDSGDAQIRVLLGQFRDTGAIARSHPTYYAVAWSLYRALHVDAAWAANLVSALAGVITVANFAWLAACFVRRRLALACAVALLTLSHTLWQLAAVAEVMTFSTMCLSFELICVVCFARTGRLGWLVLVGLANGVGWSTHNFALLTWPAYVVLAARRWKTIPTPRVRSLVATAAAWVVGCVPLLLLAVAEYREANALAETARSIFLGRHAQDVLNTTISANLVLRLVAYVGLNFPTPLILLAVPGWWRLRRAGSSGTWLFFTVAGATFLVFAARYSVPDQYTFLVHSYVFAALFAAVGLDWWLERYGSLPVRVVVVLLSIVGPVVYAAAPSLAARFAGGSPSVVLRHIRYREPYRWFLTPWRTGYDGAERYAREVFALLPPEAVLFIDTTPRRPLEYLQQRDALRRDVRLVNPKYPQPWWDRPRIRVHNVGPYIEQGLVYSASDRPGYVPKWAAKAGYRYVPVGCLFRVELPEGAPSEGDE